MRIWSGLFLMAVMFTAAREAAAVEVGVSVGSRRHGSGGVIEFRTGDSHYNTWYPSSSTYVYTQPSYSTTYVTPSYTYRTPSVGYSSWYGNDRYRSYNNHRHHNHHNHRDRDRDHDHRHNRR